MDVNNGDSTKGTEHKLSFLNHQVSKIMLAYNVCLFFHFIIYEEMKTEWNKISTILTILLINQVREKHENERINVYNYDKYCHVYSREIWNGSAE